VRNGKGNKTLGKETVNKIVRAKKQFPAKKNGKGKDKAEKKKGKKQDEGNKWKSKPRARGSGCESQGKQTYDCM
jgi:hypothetical protein